MMLYAYPCNLTPDEDGGLVVTFPDVPEAITGGENRSQALEAAENALATALIGYVHEQWEVPDGPDPDGADGVGHVRENREVRHENRGVPFPSEPSEGQRLVAVPIVVAAKLALYSVMRAQGITEAELAERLRISKSAARKLVDPDRGSHISQVQKALRAVGYSLAINTMASDPNTVNGKPTLLTPTARRTPSSR